MEDLCPQHLRTIKPESDFGLKKHKQKLANQYNLRVDSQKAKKSGTNSFIFLKFRFWPRVAKYYASLQEHVISTLFGTLKAYFDFHINAKHEDQNGIFNLLSLPSNIRYGDGNLSSLRKKRVFFREFKSTVLNHFIL